ncbi:LCP family protein [Pelosinus sp. sgz500959]|uniref:LCP family protein n=1 Tax=Pelosinus sp. sgz500959 TaxID=3242472 RepID=UPI003670D71E
MEQDVSRLSSSKRQIRRFRKGRVAMLLTMIIFLVAGVTYAFLSGPSSTNTLVSTFLMKEKINILVLGVDARDDDVGRSDTTFVVTIDTIGKKITMLSIPRDSRVKIDGHGWDKINHAYAFGGAKLSKSSVENLLTIPVDYTVVINFQGFVHMIDAIGGVTIDVDKRMYYSDPYDDDGGLYIDLRPGIQKLNGKTAMEYVRYRDEEGDIGRVSRQQKFLKGLLKELSEPQIITSLPNLIKEFAIAVKTDMPSKEMVKLIPIISEAAKIGLYTEWVAGTPYWIHDVSYWLPDIKELRYKVAQIQGLTVDGLYTQVTDRLVSEYANSIPREIKVVESLPDSKKTLKLDKQNTDSIKTITAAVSSSDQVKGNQSSVNGKNSADPINIKNTNYQNTEVAGANNEKIHNNMVTSIKSK